MVNTPVYMDNHATTRVDPRVVDTMLPLFDQSFGNAGSTSHSFGWAAAETVDAARRSIAHQIGASEREIVFTSGATESNNLAIRGVVERQAGQRKSGQGRHILSVVTEHKAVLDPLRRVARRGYDLTLLNVQDQTSDCPGRVDLNRFSDALRADTVLVSIMLANNEIGVLQPMAEICEICKQKGILVHTDATQAVGRIPIDAATLQVDLMSFSGHKIYGPKGVGALFVRGGLPRVRLAAQIDGGGQERGRRSGTLNVPGIVGMATALQLCNEELPAETKRLLTDRNRLFDGLSAALDDVALNGPVLDSPTTRLAGNLNCSFAGVDGEALMMSMRDLAVSSGSACTSTNPEPSHVLRALGLNDDLTRASLRFGLGRFNTSAEVDFAIQLVSETVDRLRQMRSLN
ncbi:MAG: aminotransferase class V-fold PLP-dependent enzyme [Planctomycetota bacterium]|nr:aminotransferase class V-fold PLP-dependent enzyme [Planctomycetota bacterium]